MPLTNPPIGRIPAAHVAAVSIGNALEFYDFLTFSLFAVYIGEAFFPGKDATIRLLSALVAFWIGFLGRPIGALVLGPLGDRIGRKPAMLISFVMIGMAMLGLALTPTYAQIGIFAPILVVVFRLIQGFALGGNVGPTTAYMLEAAPPERRGFYANFQYASQGLAVFVSALAGLLLARLLGPHELAAWGWRIAFLFGVIIVPFGIWLRERLPETLEAAAGAPEAPDAPSRIRPQVPIRPYLRIIACGFFLLVSGTIVTYALLYLTTFALDTLKLSPGVAFGVNAVNAVTLVIFSLVGGTLSDRLGRRPVIIVSAIIAALVTWPLFWAIVHQPGWVSLFAGVAVLSIVTSLAAAPVIVSLTEGLPPAIRSGGVAIVYAVAISMFGGATQPILKGVLAASGNPMVPAWFLIGATVLAVPAALLMRESAPAKAKPA